MEYDLYMKNKSIFSAVVKFDGNTEEVFDVEINKPECKLTYDEVVDAIDDAIVNKYPEYEICPDCIDDDYECPYEIVDIVINDGEESYPVIAEDDDDSELKKSKAFTKYLVLPYATYSLTPECKLWMKLKENGIISEDEPFDYEKYHKMVEDVNM